MELKLMRLRRWLFALCQARAGQCLKSENATLHCGSGGATARLARDDGTSDTSFLPDTP